ncbi:MAG TPA: glycosyltransferase [Woeseiaceae bacterium]
MWALEHATPTDNAGPAISGVPLQLNPVPTSQSGAVLARAAPRVALYSHDTMGLGHMRRNLLIAAALRHTELRPDLLLITGAITAGAFAVPPGVDCLTLPSLRKKSDGHYQARRLNLPLREIVALRAQIMRATLRAFAPDVLIVDNVPRGAARELDSVLAYIRREAGTRCVLGLRDVLDEPGAVHREWQRARNAAAINDYYDSVWVYGDPTVYDLVSEYGFPDKVAHKVQFTGYLDPRTRAAASPHETTQMREALALPRGKIVVCLVGGGEDGARLADAFTATVLPDDTTGVLVTGPYMPMETQLRLRRRCSANPQLRVLDFLPEPAALLSAADRVIAMGGYNTICEILAFGKHALIVPRVTPRREQWVRAERLRQLGMLDVLHPDKVQPQRLSAWLRKDLATGPTRSIDLNGLSRVECLLGELLAAQKAAEPVA